MPRKFSAVFAAAWMIAASGTGWAQVDPSAYHGRWKHGIPADTSFFPIAVWLQSPSNAARYKQAGINLYIGLWQGPTQAQLTALAGAGMRVICDQNSVGLQDPASKTIVGWMHDDEPDNAQARPGGGYDPCIPPSQIVTGYQAMRAKDSTRPVYLNLGRGVAVTDWIGRGTCTGRTDMYPEYGRGADILSFDVYPVNSGEAQVRGSLWYVAKGVDSLRKWSGNAKPVWAWIETSRIAESPPDKPTPAQVRSQVWMALIHGAASIGYFCHSFYPATQEAAFLGDDAMLAGITAVNLQIQGLAPVLNSPSASGIVSVTSSAGGVPIDILVKRHGGSTYVFAAAMRPGQATATFTLPGGAEAEVLGENRRIPVVDGKFSDAFSGYGVHLYRVAGTGTGVLRNPPAGEAGPVVYFRPGKTGFSWRLPLPQSGMEADLQGRMGRGPLRSPR